MGQALQVIKPVEGINTDIAAKYLKPTQIRYGLNLERTINNLNGGLGYNNAVSTPSHSNILADYLQPLGYNQRIGSYKSRRTAEVYVWVYNSLGNHHIYRINKNNTIDVLLMDPLLNFSPAPRYRIRHAHLFYNHNSFVEQKNKLIRKYLTWTAGDNWQGFLDVETSLATGGFNIPYFATADRTQLWQLPTRPSLTCPLVDFDPLSVDATKNNLIADNTWEFRIKYIYTDGRETAWSPVSVMLVANTGTCGLSTEGQPRCITLQLDAGGPHVEKIVLAFRNCAGGVTPDQNAEWFETDIIDKYAPCLNSQTPFYQRAIRNDFDYDPVTNTFLYTFCKEGTCKPIDRAETDRNYIGIPKTSFGLMPIENKIGLLNNTWGDDPIDCAELAKITFSEEDRMNAQCQPKMCKVKVAIVVHNMFNWLNQPIYVREEINSDSELEGKQQLFGGLRRDPVRYPLLGPDPDAHMANPEPFKQIFAETSVDAGFICYVEGAAPAAVTKQYKNNGGVLEEVGVIDNWGFKDRISTVADDIRKELVDGNYYFVQIAELNVVQGTKGFIRVASHLSKLSDDYRSTSTTIVGVYRDPNDINSGNFGNPYHSTKKILQENTDWSIKEIWFDTCGETEVDKTATPFVLCDLVVTNEHFFIFPGRLRHNYRSRAFAGYIYEPDTVDITKRGRIIEGAWVSPHWVPGSLYYNSWVRSHITDYNGFYFASFVFDDAWYNGEHPLGVDFEIQGHPTAGGPDCHQQPGKGDVRGAAAIGLLEANTSVTLPDYDVDFYKQYEVDVNDASGGAIQGVTIVMEGAKAQITNPQGKAFFLVRREMFGNPDLRKIVLMQSGVCYLTGPGCDPCQPKEVEVQVPDCPDGTTQVISNFSNAGLSVQVMDSGYHPGGIYPFAIKLIDAAGRETAAEKLTAPYQTITLDSLQIKQHFTFSDILFHLNGFTAPAEYVKMSILIGNNRAFDDFVTWVADDVEFVDSAGMQASASGASKILLSIRSLYDTAFLYAFGTNVRYSWLKGDRVEIITNADGDIYPVCYQCNIEGYYNNADAELKEGEDHFNKLAISYNPALSGLKPGCLIKMIRQGVCENAEFYYECCDTIELKNGVPQVTDGYISGWDTYMVRRGIRWDDVTHEFPFPFLHHSPNDFWGDHCVPRGRVSIPNPYAKRLQYGRELRLSNTFLENSNYNGLNDYQLPPKTFSGEQRGDIVFTVSMEQLFMMICERDNFIVNSATEFVRVNNQGQLMALPPEAIISDAQSKIVGNFGCSYEDADAVVVGDGWVFWVDRMNGLPVFHDWNAAQDASVHPQDGPQVSGYWKRKLMAAAAKDITAGYDSISRNVMVTFYDAISYVHSNRDYIWDGNETIAFNVADRRWPTSYSFTPEGYCCFPDNDAGDIFITFKEGKPWLHRVMSNPVWNNFYGVAVDEIFEFILNEVPEKVKVFLNLQQQATMPYFADRIISSLGHASILPPAYVTRYTEGKWDAHFLMDSNKDLWNGPPLRGNWLQVRMIRDNAVATQWNTVDPAKQVLYSELDRIISRYAFSEQSAYNTNNQ